MSSVTPSTLPSDILAFIKGNCKHLLGSSKFWETRFLCKIEAGWKSDKVETKYLVLSKFRFFFLTGKSTAKLQLESSHHLLSITEINATNESELLLGIDGRRLHVRLTDSGFNAIDISRQFLLAFKHYFPSCDPQRFVQLEPSSLYALFTVLPRSRPSLPCDGFRRTYASLCDMYKYPFRDEVVWDIEKIYTLHHNTVLRLDDFSHLLSKDLVPLIASLQFMSWFNGISSETFKLASEVVETIVLVVKKSQFLRTLSLKNCGLKSDFLASLAGALTANPSIPLENIDFSNNSFEEHKAVAQFATSLTNLSVGCRSIHFADCNLNVKAVNALCGALQQNQERLSAKTLVSLSIAKNSLKDDPTEFYHLLGACSRLETLDVSGTGISTEKIWSTLTASCKDVAAVNLSGCALSSRRSKDTNIANAVKQYLSNTSTLRVLNLTDCSLTSEVLKFLLLGAVCNTTPLSLRLILSRSFAERHCIQVLETCTPNLSIVSELVLRDINMDQDAAMIIPALARMPNLRSLDIGGNNFSGIKKHAKTLMSTLMEVAKLINDEESSLRELSISDCHLGINTSVLLNALGVAPTLLALDISGNDIGNIGARLLAKALQVNTVLQTLWIDGNQIVSEGYMDIAHSLRGNRSLRCIYYPVHDACESLKLNKEKTESALLEIEQLLRRNADKTSVSEDEYALKLQAHSRLMLSNVDDEINKAVYATEQLFSERKLTDDHPCAADLKDLLNDAEKSKKLLDDLVTIATNDFVAGFARNMSTEFLSQADEQLRVYAAKALQLPVAKGFSVCDDPEFSANLKEAVTQKVNSVCTESSDAFAEFAEKLRREFNRMTFAIASTTAEKVDQEILRLLQSSNKSLGASDRKPSTPTIGVPASPSLASSGTPKSSRAKGTHSIRPRSSMIDPNEVDDAMNEESLIMTPGDGGGSGDSNSFELVDNDALNGEELGRGDEPQKLVHPGKNRARLPYHRRQRGQAPNPTTQKDDIDYSAGVDNFFAGAKPTSVNDNDASSSPKKETVEHHHHAVEKRTSRLPANAVALLPAEALEEKVIKSTKVALTPPRPPPSSSHRNVESSSYHILASVLEIEKLQSSDGSVSPELEHPLTNTPKPLDPLNTSPAKRDNILPATAEKHREDSVEDAGPPTPTPRGNSLPRDKSLFENGNNNSGLSALKLEENNNAANARSTPAVSPIPASVSPSPPPRPPPPNMGKHAEEVKHRRQMEAEPAEAQTKPANAAQTASQRKSVMDLTAMFEVVKPPPRPVPPPRPTKGKTTPE